MQKITMDNNLKKKDNRTIGIAILIGLAAFFIALFCTYKYTLISAAVLITASVIVYILFSILEKSFFGIKATFSLVWLGTIGLSCLRLNSNQKPWMLETWICFILAYVCFMVGCIISNKMESMKKEKKVKKEFRLANLTFKKKIISEKGFFNGLILLFVVVMLCFLIQVIKLGFVPLFSSNMNAYVEFHISGVGYFVVSCIFIFPYSYYYFKNYSPSKIKILILIIINIATFLIPMLIVSRQLYILGIIIDMFAVIAVGKKKELLCFIVAVAVILGGWGLLSHFRHQNEDYLSYVFNKEAKAQTDDTALNNGSFTVNLNELVIPKAKIYTSADFNVKAASKANFKLPMSLYQLYMYVAFNYDNFNYNVFKIDRYSAGCKTLFPVFALTGIRFIVPALTNFPVCNYNTNFTTNPGIYNAYYDFGVLGVAFFMLFVGFFANTISFKKSTSSSITGIIYNALMRYSLLFFFFTSFFSNATMGFYVILVAVIHVVVSYSIKIN